MVTHGFREPLQEGQFAILIFCQRRRWQQSTMDRFLVENDLEDFLSMIMDDASTNSENTNIHPVLT